MHQKFIKKYANKQNKLRMTLINNTKQLFEEALETMKKKNADYSGTEDDGLGNFRLSAKVAKVSIPQGILIRLSDKLARIGNILHTEAKVKDETIFDTIQDGINYLAILYYAIQKENKNEQIQNN